MKRFSTAAALAAMTMLCAPAFAQAPAASAPAERAAPATPTPPGSPTPTPSSVTANPQPGSTAMRGGPALAGAATCQSMMDTAMPAMDTASAAKKAEAMRHVDMAKTAMTKNDEASCKSHMELAMTSVK